MDDPRFKGVQIWFKEYQVNPKFLEWVKEHDPDWFKELEPRLKIVRDER